MTSPTSGSFPLDGVKDPREFFLLGGTREEFLALLEAALPLSEIQSVDKAREQSRAVEEARERVQPLLMDTDILQRAYEMMQRLGLAGEERNAKILFLAFISRLLYPPGIPVNVALIGPSAVGKDYLVERVMRLFRDGEIIERTSMSDRALVYSPVDFRHKFLFFQEIEGLGDLSSQSEGENVRATIIRNILWKARLLYEYTRRDESGTFTTEIVEREGPLGAVIATTRPVEGQLSTRLIELEMDDTPVQTRRVSHAIMSRWNTDRPSEEIDMSMWYDLDLVCREQAKFGLEILFGETLANLVNDGNVRMRRDLEIFLSLCASHALLYYTQREKDARGRIIISLEDYKAVHDLTSETFMAVESETLTAAQKQVVTLVLELTAAGGYTTYNALSKGLLIDRTSIIRRLQVPLKLGYIRNNTAGKRGQPAELVPGDPMPLPVSAFPTMIDLLDSRSDDLSF